MKIPPMLLQPFVENAIKHGFIDEKIKGKLNIVMKMKGDSGMLITISDNGVGRDAKVKGFAAHKSHAMEITKERVERFNKTHDQVITYRIEDLVENGVPSGTKVMFEIPLIAA